MEKTKVWVYFATYGSHKHEVIVIEVGDEPYQTFRNAHRMYHTITLHLDSLLVFLKPYLNDNYEIRFIESPKQ